MLCLFIYFFVLYLVNYLFLPFTSWKRKFVFMNFFFFSLPFSSSTSSLPLPFSLRWKPRMSIFASRTFYAFYKHCRHFCFEFSSALYQFFFSFFLLWYNSLFLKRKKKNDFFCCSSFVVPLRLFRKLNIFSRCYLILSSLKKNILTFLNGKKKKNEWSNKASE